MTIDGAEYRRLIVDFPQPDSAQAMYDGAYGVTQDHPGWLRRVYDTFATPTRIEESTGFSLPHISVGDVYGVVLAAGNFASSAVLAGYAAAETAAYAGSKVAYWFDENEVAQSLEKMMQQNVRPLAWALGAFTFFGLAGVQYIRHRSTSSQRRIV